MAAGGQEFLFDEARQCSSVGRGVKFLQPLRTIFRQLYGSGRLFFAKLSLACPRMILSGVQKKAEMILSSASGSD
jgi:hypothetical protein